MYGMVQLGMQQLVTTRYGADTWLSITAAAGEPDLVSVSNQPYPDALKFSLVAAACDLLEIDASDLLREFGRYWVRDFAPEHYSSLLDAAGATFPEMIRSLNSLHTRAGLIFRGYQPPRFEVLEEDEQTVRLQYTSEREGLSPFVIGLLEGLGDRFSLNLEIEQVADKSQGAPDDIFTIAWL